jgi:hypothetical protein
MVSIRGVEKYTTVATVDTFAGAKLRLTQRHTTRTSSSLSAILLRRHPQGRATGEWRTWLRPIGPIVAAWSALEYQPRAAEIRFIMIKQ